MVDPISAENLLSQLEQMRSQASEMANASKAISPDAAKTADGENFQSVLGNLIKEVDGAQKQADVSLKSLASGDKGTSIQEVVMKMEQADVSFNLMLEIRNKLLSAYKELVSGQS